LTFKWRESTAFRLLALFLAIVLWVYVTHQRNPILERAARVDLQQQGLPAGMVIQEIPSSVTVYYKSSKGRLALVDAGEFEARVNLAGAEKGTHSFPVRVNGPTGVEVIRVSPQRVTLSLDRIIQKAVPVTVNILGSPAQGYQRLEPVVTPPVVEARGPSQVLQEIERVAVTVDIRGTPTGIVQVRPVSTGVEGVKLHPDTVKVTIPVESLPAGTVGVKARVQGSPAAGFRVESVSASPDLVKVTGGQDLLDRLENVTTASVDIAGAAADVTKKVKIINPQGALVEPREVDVTVEIVPDTVPGENNGAVESAPASGE